MDDYVSSAYKMLHVGSNNVNLLQPIGQFGTWLNGGKDAASPRWGERMLHDVFLFYSFAVHFLQKKWQEGHQGGLQSLVYLPQRLLLLTLPRQECAVHIHQEWCYQGSHQTVGLEEASRYPPPPCSTTSFTTFAGNLLAVGAHIYMYYPLAQQWVSWQNDLTLYMTCIVSLSSCELVVIGRQVLKLPLSIRRHNRLLKKTYRMQIA